MKRARLPSPGMVIATVALFIALGGTAVALRSSDGGHASKLDVRTLPLRDGWIAYGGDAAPPRFFVAAGVTHLEGALYGADSTSDDAFKLPAGARPKGEVIVPISAGPGSYEELIITANGVGELEGSQSENFASLDGISFRAVN